MNIPRWTTWLKLLTVMLLLEACCNKDLDVAKYSVAVASEDATEEACQSRIDIKKNSGGACSANDPLIVTSAEDYLNFCKSYCVDPNGPEYNTCRGRMTIAAAGTPSCEFDKDKDVYELVCGPVVARCVCDEPC